MMYNNGHKPDVDQNLKSKKGVFLTLEGIDGSGKTTQMHNLVAYLEKSGRQVLSLREPGGTGIGESIRDILLNRDHTAMTIETELLLFAAARAQLVRQVIRPALDRGIWVICDRFMDSTSAYQGYGRSLDLAVIKQLENIAVGDCRPDLTFLFDVSVDVAEKRLADRKVKADRLDLESRSFMEKTRQGYLRLAENEPERFRLIDAVGTEKQIEHQILKVLREDIDL
jgi:dTMP kinase